MVLISINMIASAENNKALAKFNAINLTYNESGDADGQGVETFQFLQCTASLNFVNADTVFAATKRI